MRTDLGIVAAARQVLADLRRSGRDADLQAELERLLRESDEGHSVGDAIWRLLSDNPVIAVAMRTYLHNGSETMAIAPSGGAGVHFRDRADERLEVEVPPIDVADEHVTAHAQPPHEPRWLNCPIYECLPTGGRAMLEKSFRRNTEHELEAWVGPEVPGTLVDKQGEPVDELLEGSARELTLYVQLPDSEPRPAGTFDLPAEGPSRSVTFRFHVADSRTFELKLYLYQAGRLLQQTVIKGKVLADPARAKTAAFTIGAIRVAAPNTKEQAGAERHVGIVSDRCSDGRPTLAAFGHGTCAWFDDDTLSNITSGVTTVLEQLTRDSATAGLSLDDPRIVNAFRALACLGAELRRMIDDGLGQVFGDMPLDRVQLTMARENDYVPLDFAYDFPAPATNATMCPHWVGTGAAHACTGADHPSPADARGLSPVVCPHGFWGVSKIIERQVLRLDPSASTSPRDFVLALEDRSERPALRPLSSALLASSSKVKQKDAADVLQCLTVVTGGNCDQATDWVSWAERYRGRHPALIVLLSHTDELLSMDSLEIGGDVNNTGQLGEMLRGAPPGYHPVVLLLGCKTNSPVKSARSIVTTFYGNNASLVVGTLTPVLAAHAPRVAERLLGALADADDRLREGETIGDLLRDVRRRLLASGEPIALTLTALGDLDWRVAPSGR
jgi:hypothetical protein